MAGKSTSPCIVWFRDDLRLSDHPALHAASATGAPVICLYVLDEAQRRAARASAGRRGALVAGAVAAGAAGAPQRDSARRWCCARDPRQRSSPNWRARPVPTPCSGTRSRRRRIRRSPIRSPRRCSEIGVSSHSFPGDLLVAPADIRNKEGRGLRVFTPFWRRVLALGDPPQAAARAETAAHRDRTSPAMHSKAGGSNRPARTGPAACARHGQPGEKSAQAAARAFLEGGVARLCRRPRPARPRGHLAAVAASAFRRDQPAAGLARRALCRGRAPGPVAATSTNS